MYILMIPGANFDFIILLTSSKWKGPRVLKRELKKRNEERKMSSMIVDEVREEDEGEQMKERTKTRRLREREREREREL